MGVFWAATLKDEKGEIQIPRWKKHLPHDSWAAIKYDNRRGTAKTCKDKHCSFALDSFLLKSCTSHRNLVLNQSLKLFRKSHSNGIITVIYSQRDKNRNQNICPPMWYVTLKCLLCWAKFLYFQNSFKWVATMVLFKTLQWKSSKWKDWILNV